MRLSFDKRMRLSFKMRMSLSFKMRMLLSFEKRMNSREFQEFTKWSVAVQRYGVCYNTTAHGHNS